MTLADELRTFADECHMMGLAMSQNGWHSLAEQALRTAESVEHSSRKAKTDAAWSVRDAA